MTVKISDANELNNTLRNNAPKSHRKTASVKKLKKHFPLFQKLIMTNCYVRLIAPNCSLILTW